MIRKVLVANRGEIALRVMRACREESLASVAVYSEGEDDALHARYADESVLLVSERALPYLDIDAILRAATASGADAIHPGYGFLAENAEFAEACGRAGLIFIGPPPAAIATMGDKIAARRAAIAASVPVGPGSDGPVDAEGARRFGDAVGYPIALKASAGGGGRGFRVAAGPAEVAEAWQGASGEAERYFGNPAVYAEKYLDHPRHVEIQVMADQHGAVAALGERDCSIQRRHQKLVEESPSPVVDAALRERMNSTAERLAAEVGYVGAGTIEFLVQDGEFYFLEMNTRIQVEHPVTEAVTGVDLVREQLRIAGGAPLSCARAATPWGHAIECRINAEDAARDFTPTPGRLTRFDPPTGLGVRVDTGFVSGGTVEPRFDSLIAKLIVWGRDREEALSRLDRALQDFAIDGVATTIPLHRALLREPSFRSGSYDTRTLETSGILRRLSPWTPEAQPEAIEADGIDVVVNGRTYRVRLPEAMTTGRPQQRTRPATRQVGERNAAPRGEASMELRSPIQGTVVRVAVGPGDVVAAGQLVCVVEAMKMENEIGAQHDGTVTEIHVAAGRGVQVGAVIAVIEPAAGQGVGG